MKHRIWMIAVILSVLILSVVFAQDKAQNKTDQAPEIADSDMMPCEMMEKGMMGKGMMGQGMMKQGRMGQGMMGRGMMDKDKKMVATQDGGVVVWTGNMLIKYDKNLKMVNKVELNKTGGSGVDAYEIDPHHHKPGTYQAEGDM